MRPDFLLVRDERSITICMFIWGGELGLLIFTLVFIFNFASVAGCFISRVLHCQGARGTECEENEVDRNA